MTPWGGIALGAAVIVFGGAAVLDETAPASCSKADSSREAHLLAQAEKSYTEILRNEPKSVCATQGMVQVALALCDRADTLRKAERTAEAAKLYGAVLAKESPTALSCALAGLRELSKQEAPKPSPLEVIVRVITGMGDGP